MATVGILLETHVTYIKDRYDMNDPETLEHIKYCESALKLFEQEALKISGNLTQEAVNMDLNNVTQNFLNKENENG